MAVTIYENDSRFNWIDAGWITATAYDVHDALEHNGTSYRCILAHTSAAANEPGVGVDTETYWAVVAAKGADGGGATSLDGLSDVDTTTTAPVDGDGLFFDNASGLWLPSAPAGGGGGGGGGLLAVKQHYPAAQESKTTTSTSFVDMDATNLVVSFTAPASGKVLIRLSCHIYNSTANGTMYWNLRDASGDVAGTLMFVQQSPTANMQELKSTCVLISGLTPSTVYTYKWGGKVASGTMNMRMGGAFYGPAVMEVLEAP